jgi:beta-lactamase superfamily II metal-dependent hydrolase
LLRVTIFKVERGFCAFVLSPNKYGLLIDCGTSAAFSPLKYLAEKEIPNLTKFTDRNLAYAVISHPHEDHISDIKRLIDLHPAILAGQVYNWDEIRDLEHKDHNENLDVYGRWRSELLKTNEQPRPGQTLDWGMQLWHSWLTVKEAKKVNPDTQKFVNNSSIAVKLEYNGWKFFFPGDLMEEGWKELLKRPDFVSALKGTRIFVASNHGSQSGFTQEIYDVMGKPIINIVSEKPGEEVYGAYSDFGHSVGMNWNGEIKRVFSTRNGSIVITINDDGTAKVGQYNLGNNLP